MMRTIFLINRLLRSDLFKIVERVPVSSLLVSLGNAFAEAVFLQSEIAPTFARFSWSVSYAIQLTCMTRART